MKIEDGVLLNVTDDDIGENGEFTIPDGVKSIGALAFYGCENLTSVTIPNGVTKIGRSAFSGCKNLRGITIPEGVTEIGEGAFCGCESLTSVVIPDSVKSIGAEAFRGCETLTSVTIPDSVIEIGACVFYNCSSLTSVVIPDSVNSIRVGAFAYCNCLKSKPANYKAFQIEDGELYCLNKQYKEGETNCVSGELKLCKNGIHYCTNLFEIFNYYSGVIDKDIAIYEIEVGDKVLTSEDDSKCCTNSCVLKKRLYREEIIKILNGKLNKRKRSAMG